MAEQRAIIDFSRYISDRTRDFTGREWVFQAINDWLADPGAPPFFLITGEPGSGKTAIAARLYQLSYSSETTSSSNELRYIKHGFLSAIHFCSARDTYWRNPQIFARSIALQLAHQKRYDVFAKALAEKSTDRIHIQANITAHGKNAKITAVQIGNIEIKGASTEDVFNRLIREPLQVLFDRRPNEQVIILVDALDEALVYGGDVNIVSLLADSQNLPKGVRFIITSRKDERVENRFFGSAGLYLSSIELNEQNQNDISNYARKRFFKDEKLASKVKDRTPEQLEDLIKTITVKADGNFQYVTFLLDSMSNDYQKLGEINRLPQGLDALYYESLQRMMALNDWTKEYAPLVGVLSVAQESLTVSQVQNFTELPERPVRSHLRTLTQFIDVIESSDGNINKGDLRRYRLYHQSFVDFLRRQSIRGRNGNELNNGYYLPAEEWHKIIADYYRSQLVLSSDSDWGKVDDYGLRHLASHLYMLKDTGVNGAKTYRQELYGVICKPLMQEKLIRFGSHQSFLSDIELAIEAAQHEQPPNVPQLVREILISVILRELVTEVPVEALEVLARLGMENKALWFVEHIGDNHEQIRAYLLIAKALHERGEINKAMGTLQKISDILHANEDLITRHPHSLYLLRGVGLNLAKIIVDAGEVESASKLKKKIWKRRSRKLLLADMTWGLSDAAMIFNETTKVRGKESIQSEYTKAPSSTITSFDLMSKKNRTKELKRINQQLKAAREKKTRRSRAYKLIRIAKELAEAGELESSLDVAKEAKDNMRWNSASDYDSMIYVDELRDYVESLIAIGGIDQALTEVELFPEQSKERREILLNIIEFLAHAGQREKAINIINRLLSELDKAEFFGLQKKDILLKVARFLISLHENKKAEELVNQVVLQAEVEQVRSVKVVMQEIFLRIAEVLVNIPRFSQKALAITDAIWYLESLVETVQMLSKVGQHSKATELADKMMQRVAKMKDSYNHASDAHIIADKIEATAMALIWAGKTDEALCIADEVEHCKAEVSAKIAQVLVEVGNITKAVSLAYKALEMTEKSIDDDLLRKSDPGQILDESFCIEGTLRAAAPLVALGDDKAWLDEMLAIGERLVGLSGGAELKQEMLDNAVTMLVKAGMLDRALVVTEKIEDKLHKADALTIIAYSLAKAGNRSEAEKIVSQALELSIGHHSLDEDISSRISQVMDEFYNSYFQAIDQGLSPETSLWQQESMLYKLSSTIAQIMVELEKFDQAAKLAETYRIFGLSRNKVSLLQVLYKIGQHERAISLWKTELINAQFADEGILSLKLEEGVPIIAAIDQGQTLWKIYEAIVEIESWWKT
jgi:tetratricopeptide (TPR) repeat protein